MSGAAVVLATVRSGDPAPDPVVALWKDGLAERIEVAGLDADATAALLVAVLDGPVDPATAALLAERSQGNALFIRELVEGALDDGSLRDRRGDLAAGRRDRPVGAARRDRRGPPRPARPRRARPCSSSWPTASRWARPSSTTLSDLRIAEALERRGLLASHLDGRRLQVRLAHPLYGDVVRARTPAVRARAIAESLADAVEQAGTARHEDALRIATWRLTAGDGDPRLLLEGATIARWRDDFPLAERLARAAADAGAGFDADLLAAHVTGLLGRPDDADAELAELEERVDDDAERSRVAIARFDTSAVWTAVDDGDVLGTALAAVADPTWRDRLEARRLAVVLNAEGPRAAVDAAGPVLARAEGEALAFACARRRLRPGPLRAHRRGARAVRAGRRGAPARSTAPWPGPRGGMPSQAAWPCSTPGGSTRRRRWPATSTATRWPRG